MQTLVRLALPLALVALALPGGALAEHGSADEASPNMLHLANLPTPAAFLTGPASEARFNSDLAFHGDLVAQGNYDGFRLVDVSDPARPREVAVVECRANQGDLSFYRARGRLLLIQSIEEPVTTPECATARDTGVAPGTHPILGTQGTFRVPGFEGLRIFDVSDASSPRLIAAVATACGSHTHTTLTDQRNRRGIVYVSSYPTGARLTPLEGLNYGGPVCVPPHAKISIVEIPDANPEAARVLKEQPLHADTLPWRGALGQPGGTGAVGCHDITVFEPTGSRAVAGAACLEEGQLWDVSDPANPTTTGAHSHIRNKLVSVEGLFHTASFTWDGEVVLFTDEYAGGGGSGCKGEQDTRGNVWFHANVAPGVEPVPLYGRYMIPRVQPPQDACTLHNGNVIPTGKGYYGVSSAYEAGTTVFDFSAVTSFPAILDPVLDTSDPVPPLVADEVAFFDAKADGKGVDDAWSSYWHNDYVYSSSGLMRPGQRGLDTYLLLGRHGRLTPPVSDPGAPGVQQVRARKLPQQNPQTQSMSGR